MKILKWLLKHIWQPLSELFSRILGNHLVQGLLSYFSFKLLETSKANQILANVMLWFAIFAFGLYILEKIFGVKTPLIKIGKIFKPFRSSKLFENPNSLQDNFEMIHQDSKKIYKFIKKKGRKNMKILKIIGIALTFIFKNNLITNVGNTVSIYLYYNGVKWLFDKYGTWSNVLQDKYFIIGTIAFIVLIIAVNGPGLEKPKAWFTRRSLRKFNHLYNLLLTIDIKLKTNVAKKFLSKANKYLSNISNYIREEDYIKFVHFLTEIEASIYDFEDELILKDELKRQEALAKAQARKQAPTQQSQGVRLTPEQVKELNR